MVVHVFVIDTSASMNQEFQRGFSKLDCAKNAVEQFFKWETKRNDNYNNKYMLVTYDDFPSCIKSYPEQSISHLLKELKHLKAYDLSQAGQTMASIFDFLNVYRFRKETIGSGRYIGNLETTLLYWFTDGGTFYQGRGSEVGNMSDNLSLPGLTSAGASTYIEPFRWDQRLYTILLNTENIQPRIITQLRSMSENMGGECWSIDNIKSLIHCIDNCMGGVKPLHPDCQPQRSICAIEGVTVFFEEESNQPNRLFGKALVYANSVNSTRNFPIPENYWVESVSHSPVPPPRTAHPKLIFSLQKANLYSIPESFPVDRFHLDPCYLTVKLEELSNQKPGTCVPLFVKNSYIQEGLGHPCGFLKFSTQERRVSFYILPYNFPRLFKLIDQVYKKGTVIKQSIPMHWSSSFYEYLKDTPSYYWESLRRALKQIGLAENIMPKQFVESKVSPFPAILSTLKANTKLEYSRIIKSKISEAKKITEMENSGIGGICENPFDVERSNLLATLTSASLYITEKLASNNHSENKLKKKKKRLSQLELDELHSLPIAEMGNYIRAASSIQKLKDPFEDEETTKQREKSMFGNPYKKDTVVSIDEADEAQSFDSDVSVKSSEREDDEESISSGSTVKSNSSTSSLLRRSKSGSIRRAKLRSTSPTPTPISPVINRVPKLALTLSQNFMEMSNYLKTIKNMEEKEALLLLYPAFVEKGQLPVSSVKRKISNEPILTNDKSLAVKISTESKSAFPMGDDLLIPNLYDFTKVDEGMDDRAEKDYDKDEFYFGESGKFNNNFYTDSTVTTKFISEDDVQKSKRIKIGKSETTDGLLDIYDSTLDTALNKTNLNNNGLKENDENADYKKLLLILENEESAKNYIFKIFRESPNEFSRQKVKTLVNCLKAEDTSKNLLFYDLCRNLSFRMKLCQDLFNN
ncbi:Integrator complex subunit 6 [Lobulomyces angularis]|nr:Integrator complex subunit 6 [Lobulomyces angularis]